MARLWVNGKPMTRACEGTPGASAAVEEDAAAAEARAAARLAALARCRAAFCSAIMALMPPAQLTTSASYLVTNLGMRYAHCQCSQGDCGSSNFAVQLLEVWELCAEHIRLSMTPHLCSGPPPKLSACPQSAVPVLQAMVAHLRWAWTLWAS